jgi:hypothetical protein
METTLQGRGQHVLRRLVRAVVWLELPTIAIWLALAVGLSAITRRVVDWFVMTDELLYERLAISITQLHSPLPHVHDVLIPNASQLYPLLIAPAFAHGYVPESLHSAHILNAYIMTSAAIPAFLLARSVTRRRAAAYFVAVLSVCVPWIVFSSFLLTEVAAYPAFLWAILALQRATVTPRIANDVLALLGIALATLARTQFFVLVLVLAPAILLHETAFAEGSDWRSRLRAGCRRAVKGHPLLAGFYALLTLVVVVLSASGRLSSAVGTYAQAVQGNPFPSNFIPSLAEHVAAIALGLAVLPFVIGAAWLVAGLVGSTSRERHAFSVLGTLTFCVLALEVTSFDLRFGGGVVRERYLFYVVPLILVAFAGALCDRRWPRWSLLVPLPLLLYGFWHSGLKQYEKLNIDTPVSMLNDPLLEIAHKLAGSGTDLAPEVLAAQDHRIAHIILVAGTIVLTALFVEASLLLRRTYLVAVLAAVTAIALPLETRYAFERLFAVNGTAGRPLTYDQGGVFNWVDRTLGTEASVAMVPYPSIPGDFWSGVGFWWDMEFWNKSVDRAVHRPGEFLWTPSTFPRTFLRFDPKTGIANESPAPYVVQSNKETRFRISGDGVSLNTDPRDNLLIRAAMPWRTDWLTFGLTADGWTKPGVTARVRVYASLGQTRPVTRTLTVGVKAPLGIEARPFSVVSKRSMVSKVANGGFVVRAVVAVCVPAGGYADVRVSTPESSETWNDPRSAATAAAGPPARQAGVLLTEIVLADEVTPTCS